LRSEHARPFFDFKKSGMLRQATPFVQDLSMLKGQRPVTYIKKLRQDA
jgi:hypothetical protein